MTPDLDAIRAALAAATPYASDPDFGAWCDSHPARMALWRDAPTWLAALCDEIERLQGEWGGVPMTLDAVATRHVEVLRERDAALAEIERLRAQLEAKS